MYWDTLLGMVREAFPTGKTLAILGIVLGFSLWGPYLYSVMKPVTEPVVEAVETTIRPSVGPNKVVTKNNKQQLTPVPDISQEPSRVLLI